MDKFLTYSFRISFLILYTIGVIVFIDSDNYDILQKIMWISGWTSAFSMLGLAISDN